MTTPLTTTTNEMNQMHPNESYDTTAVFYYVGSYFYQKGYIDTSLDVATARYKKGGAIKWIGFLTSMISTISLAISMIKSK